MHSSCLQALPYWTLSCCRRLQEAQAEHASISASLASANEATNVSQAAAVERQKRFSLLNSQFKNREQALQKEVDKEKEAGASAKAEVQKLATQQASHDQACQKSCPSCYTTCQDGICY